MKTTVTLVIVGVVLGGAAGFAIGQARSEREMKQVILANSLETIGLCANGLNSLAGRDAVVTVRLLDYRLRSAVDSATALSDAGASFPLPAPNLNESLRRAKKYADDSGDRNLAARIARLQSAIGPYLTGEGSDRSTRRLPAKMRL